MKTTLITGTLLSLTTFFDMKIYIILYFLSFNKHLQLQQILLLFSFHFYIKIKGKLHNNIVTEFYICLTLYFICFCAVIQYPFNLQTPFSISNKASPMMTNSFSLYVSQSFHPPFIFKGLFRQVYYSWLAFFLTAL